MDFLYSLKQVYKSFYANKTGINKMYVETYKSLRKLSQALTSRFFWVVSGRFPVFLDANVFLNKSEIYRSGRYAINR